MYSAVPVPAGRQLVGVEAVIDKDLASAMLAADLGADALLIVTDVDAVYTDWGTPQQRAIKRGNPGSLARAAVRNGIHGSQGPCRMHLRREHPRFSGNRFDHSNSVPLGRHGWDHGHLGRQGARAVLACLRRTGSDQRLRTAALLGIVDPRRPAAKAGIATARSAGICVRMITDDHAVTATTICDPDRLRNLEGESNDEPAVTDPLRPGR